MTDIIVKEHQNWSNLKAQLLQMIQWVKNFNEIMLKESIIVLFATCGLNQPYVTEIRHI